MARIWESVVTYNDGTNTTACKPIELYKVSYWCDNPFVGEQK